MTTQSPEPTDLSTSPSSTTSTLSATSDRTERPRDSPSSPPSSAKSSNEDPTVTYDRGSSRPKAIPRSSRPSLLRPPATIVSPPSPIEPSSSTLSSSTGIGSPLVFSSSPASDSGAEDGQCYARGHTTSPPGRAAASRSSGHDYARSPRPIAATSLSLSPRFVSPATNQSELPESPRSTSPANHNRRDSLAVPVPTTGSPLAQTPETDGGDHYFARATSPSPSSSPRVTPSSPHAYPKRIGHRRESSTHRVKETPNGQQRSTADGETMVNQYRIGKPLGKGGFAKVELAVDVGTGIEYVGPPFR
jgi:[calcium/calmodulin-dependent protein kinase] kinase